MDPLERPLITAMAMVAALAALVLLALPGPLVAAGWPAVGTPVPLGCQLQPLGAAGARLTLTHDGAATLPAGTRLAWVTLGEAAPQGEVLKLPRALARGESITLDTPRVGPPVRCAAVASVGPTAGRSGE